MSQKHLPVRTCVACGAKASKRELFRVVRTPAGELLVDDSGKRSGRGAYLCRKPSCWQQALKGRRLAHALRSDITEEDRSRLAGFGASLS